MKLDNPILWLVRKVGGKEPHPLWLWPASLSFVRSAPLPVPKSLKNRREKKPTRKLLDNETILKTFFSRKESVHVEDFRKKHSANGHMLQSSHRKPPLEAERHTERNPGTSFSFLFPGALPFPTIPACFICLLNAPSTDFSVSKNSRISFSLRHRAF